MDARGPITQARISVDARGLFHIPEGPITRARAKTIKEALNRLIKDIQTNQASNGANSS
jgi:hypothetical protein